MDAGTEHPASILQTTHNDNANNPYVNRFMMDPFLSLMSVGIRQNKTNSAPGTAFQKDVRRELQRTPYGETRCYDRIVRKVGRPGAQKTVERANGDNRVAIRSSMRLSGDRHPGRIHRLRRDHRMHLPHVRHVHADDR